MFRIALAILAFTAPSVIFWPCNAMAKGAEPTSHVYEGAVGAAPVVVTLDISGNSVSGNYFYSGKWFDIDLQGEAKKGALQLKSNATGDKLTLKPTASGYVGALTTAKRKTLVVELRAIGPEAASNVPADAADGLNLYEKMRASGLTLKPQKAETIAGKSVRWYVEPVSGLRLFRIESGYAAPAMETMNKALTRVQWRNISDYFGCLSSEGGPGAESSVDGSPYFSDAYVSFALNTSWDCAGAAHPDSGSEGHSFDARTGKELWLDDVLKFGKGATPQKDSDAWLEYRSKTFAPALVALLKRFHPKEMAPHDDDCDYSEADVWSFPAWRLTVRGVYVGASFPRVARNCDNPEWSIIPYSALNE